MSFGERGNGEVRLEGEARLPGTANYLRGADPRAWRTAVPTYQAIAYRDLFPGIDLLFHGDAIGTELEHDFVVRPGADPDAAAQGWIAGGTRLVILTQGGEGATAWVPGARVSMPAAPVELVDTVGAGDSFIAAALFQLDRMGLLAPAAIGRIGMEEARQMLEFAVRVAAATCGRVGADPPRLHEIEPAGAGRTSA